MRTKMEETNNGERIRPGGSSRKSKPAILPLLSSAATRRIAGTLSRAERDLNVPAGEHRDSMGRETEGKDEGRGKALRWRRDSRFLFPFFLSLKTSFFSGHVVSAKLSAGKKEGGKKKKKKRRDAPRRVAESRSSGAVPRLAEDAEKLR